MTQVKRILRIALPLSLLVLTLFLPRVSAEGVWEGAKIACRGALPALFPALVLSGILTSSHLPGGRYLPLVLGLVCGFPVGAITVCEMKKQGVLDRRSAERLLFCCCNTGPAFVVGFCGTALGSVRAGAILYGMECAVALLLFFLFVPKNKTNAGAKEALSLYDAITRAAESFLSIAGCVLFFSCVASLLLAILPVHDPGEALLRLLLEVTGGVTAAAKYPLSASFPLCAAGIGWAGLSVCLQTAGPVRRAGLDLKWYIAGRVVFTIALFLLSLPVKKLL